LAVADFFYDMQNVAKQILGDFNQGVIQHVQVIAGSGPADNPGEPTTSTTTLTQAVARGVEFKFLKSSDILQTDLQITFPGGIVEPQPSDFFVVDGTQYKVVEIHKTPAAGIVVTFKVIVRK
jgi:hypothetical protein